MLVFLSFNLADSSYSKLKASKNGIFLTLWQRRETKLSSKILILFRLKINIYFNVDKRLIIINKIYGFHIMCLHLIDIFGNQFYEP